MENKIKRPPSVLIAQTILICLALVFLAPFPLIIGSFFNRPSLILRTVFSFSVAIYAVMAVAFLVTFWGLMFRKSYGRWLAVGMLTIVFGFALVNGLLMTFRSAYNPPLIASVMYSVLGILVLPVIHRLVFGKRVTAFFNEKLSQIPVQDPPSPPTFDD